MDEFGYSAPRLEDEYYEIWRLDLSTKETVRLGDTQSFKLPYADAGMLKYDSETVTWGIGREIVVTDYDFNIISVEDHNRETFAWQVGEYAYRSKKAADPDAASYGAKDYYLVDSSGEEKLIIENMLRMIMVDDKIVYMKYDKDKCRVVFSKEDIPDLKNEYVQYFNNEIYIMNADGSDAHLIGTVMIRISTTHMRISLRIYRERFTQRKESALHSSGIPIHMRCTIRRQKKNIPTISLRTSAAM